MLAYIDTNKQEYIQIRTHIYNVYLISSWPDVHANIEYVNQKNQIIGFSAQLASVWSDVQLKNLKEFPKTILQEKMSYMKT